MRFFKNFARDESGASTIGYGLVSALIAVAAITAIAIFGKETCDPDLLSDQEYAECVARNDAPRQ